MSPLGPQRAGEPGEWGLSGQPPPWDAYLPLQGACLWTCGKRGRCSPNSPVALHACPPRSPAGFSQNLPVHPKIPIWRPGPAKMESPSSHDFLKKTHQNETRWKPGGEACLRVWRDLEDTMWLRGHTQRAVACADPKLPEQVAQEAGPRCASPKPPPSRLRASEGRALPTYTPAARAATLPLRPPPTHRAMAS